jgi:hypothetical protein
MPAADRSSKARSSKRRKAVRRERSDPVSKVNELIESKLKRQKKGCWGWSGALSKSGAALLIVKTKTGRKTIDVARRLFEQESGEELEDSDELIRAKHCDAPGCANPRHFELKRAGELDGRRQHTNEQISKFKRQIAAGARVGEIYETYGLCRSWAYQIANGERYAEIEPKGSVLKRVKTDLTKEKVERARRLRAKNWTYQRIGEKLDIHHSTARDACLNDRPNWQ